MAYQHTLKTVAFKAPDRYLALAVDLVRLWSERYRTRRHLRELDSYRLEDIGLTRQQAVAEAKKFFWQA